MSIKKKTIESVYALKATGSDKDLNFGSLMKAHKMLLVGDASKGLEEMRVITKSCLSACASGNQQPVLEQYSKALYDEATKSCDPNNLNNTDLSESAKDKLFSIDDVTKNRDALKDLAKTRNANGEPNDLKLVSVINSKNIGSWSSAKQPDMMLKMGYTTRTLDDSTEVTHTARASVSKSFTGTSLQLSEPMVMVKGRDKTMLLSKCNLTTQTSDGVTKFYDLKSQPGVYQKMTDLAFEAKDIQDIQSKWAPCVTKAGDFKTVDNEDIADKSITLATMKNCTSLKCSVGFNNTMSKELRMQVEQEVLKGLPTVVEMKTFTREQGSLFKYFKSVAFTVYDAEGASSVRLG